LEQIRVRAGSGQLHFLTVHPVQQQPIWLDVRVSIPLPVSPQRVILIRLRQWRLMNQQAKQRLQFV
jgi:hypothetical protein